MLESDWLSNVLRCAIIFREMHGERSSRQLSATLHDHITSQNDLLFQRSYNSKITKAHNDSSQTENTVYKRIKSTDLVHVFATQLHFIMYGKHIAYSLPPSQTHILFAHTLT